MKLITAIIKPFKVDDVRQAIADLGVQGVTITECRIRPPARPHRDLPRREYRVDFLPKTKVEIAVDDTIVEQVIEAITTSPHRQDRRRQDLRHPAGQAVRIRTGESARRPLGAPPTLPFLP